MEAMYDEIDGVSLTEDIFKEIVDGSNIGITIHKPDSTIIYLNQYMADLMGYPREYLIGRSSLEFLVAEEKETILKSQDELKLKKHVTIERRIIRKDGSILWTRIDLKSRFDRSGNFEGYIAVHNDITDQKHAEKALEETRMKEELLIKSAPTGIYELDYLGPKFLSVNDTMCEISGYTREELLSMNPFDLLDQQSAMIFRERIRSILNGGDIPESVEYKIRAKDGKVLWAVLNIKIIAEKGKPPRALVIAHNITNRKKIEEALRESEERLKKVLEVEAVGVMFWDLTTGCLVDANKTFLKMMGYSRSDIEVSNLTWQKFTPPEYHDVSLAEIKKFQTTGRVGPYEKEYLCKDGTRKWLLFSGSSLGGQKCVEFCIDISDRKKAEQALDAAHLQIQSIIDKSTAIIYAFDLEERFLLANVALAKLLNSSPEKMIGKRRQDFMPKEDADWHEENDRKVIATGKMQEFEEYSNLKDRSITWLTTKFPLYDINGQIYAVAGISADVSEYKELERDLKKYATTLEDRVRERTEDLQKLNEALMKSNKELENFAYFASHDLQEPLRMVSSFTQLLEKQYGDILDARAKEYIGYAVDGAKRMYDLINSLLAYSRINKAIRFVDVDLNIVVEKVKANLKFLIQERNCSIDTFNLPNVYADMNQMIQIFQNLISNSIKFSTKDPVITISARKEDVEYVISVKDEGVGIEPQYFDKIFEIFRRLHSREQFEGTGVGLAICKKIVENHKGRIWVKSEPGHGSEFYFTIPIQSKI